MEWVVENWAVIVALLALTANLCFAIYGFSILPSEGQISKVKEWLLYAVAAAEREMGGGTGRLKLRYVYDMFVGKFPWMAKAVSFETFSGWVDDALAEMRRMLETNAAAQGYVEGD